MLTACCVAHVLLAFVPAPADDGLIERLARDSFAVGVVSPEAGGPSAAQTYLDMSQGTRVSTRRYDEPLPSLSLRPDGRIEGWPAAVARAEDAPGTLVPGLLGETITSAGGRVAYAGVQGLGHDEAAVGANASGRLATVSLGSSRGFGSRLERLLRTHALVVARLPLGAQPKLLEPLADDATVIVVRAPRADAVDLLETGMIVPGRTGEAALSSRTTRRDGMVSVTDYAPTVLDALDLDVPDDMEGRVFELVHGSWEDVQSLADRLGHIKGRRGPALRGALAAWLVALAALALAGRARVGLRLGLLTGIWLPGVALFTGALDPARGAETAILAVAPLALAAATDRIAGWPRAPAVAAGAVLAAHAVDLVAGSPLIVRSLAGPNPAFGARFYGIGNELEAILSAAVLLGTGALLWGRAGRVVPAGFGTACAFAAVFVGAGRLGADVGGVITLAAGGAAAVLASLPGGVTRRAVTIALLMPALGLGLLAAIDLVSGGDAHLTRSVLDAESPGELVDIVERRFEISWDALKSGTTPLSVGALALVLGVGVARRKSLLAPLERDRAFAAGMWGTLAATIVGALANDSGPTIFLIGGTALVLGAAYVTGKPRAGGLT